MNGSKTIKQVLVIGSGPSAWAVCEGLISRYGLDGEITIIDPSENLEFCEKSIQANPRLKSYFGSRHVYGKSDKYINFQSFTNLSYAWGGLSKVWGSGIRLWDMSVIQQFVDDTDRFYDSAKYLLERMGYFGNMDTLNLPVEITPINPPSGAMKIIQKKIERNEKCTDISQTSLAVKTDGPNACRNCGKCLSGCPYGAIFDSGTELGNMVNLGKVKRMKGKVITVVPTKFKAAVSYSNKDQIITSAEYDEVYLCAGAVGTPAILMRSSLLSNQMVVSDSQVFFFIGLYRSTRHNSGSFALSQLTVSKANEYSASIYESNEDVRTRIAKQIKIRIFGKNIKLPKLFDKFVFVGIGFLPSDKSGKIILNRSSDQILRIELDRINNPTTCRYARSALKNIRRELRKIGLFVLPIMRLDENPGAGFHSGCSLVLDGPWVDSAGRLRSFPQIRVADVSILPFLKEGPHTFTSMVLNHYLRKVNP